MSPDQIKKQILYRNLFENSFFIMLIVDPKTGLIMDVNKAAVAFYGYDRKEMIGMKLSRLNALSEKQIKAEMQKAQRLKQDYFHLKHRLESGQIKDVEVYSGPIDYENKKVLCTIVRDISERTETLKILKERESTIRAMINATKSLVYLFDVDGNIINLNNPGALLFNKSPREMIGQNFKEYFGDNDFSRLRMLVQEVVDTHEPISYQKDRENRYYSVHLYPVFNTDNEVDRICVFANDITDLKMSEKVIAAIETAGGICHEMNQPLQVLLGNLEILKLNLEENDPNLELVDTLLIQTEKLGAITKKLTNITRYETKTYIKGTIFDIDNSSKSD